MPPIERSSADEYADYFRDRGGLHFGRPTTARSGVAILYPLFGASVRAASYYTILIAIGEFFYHWNIKTPSWIGFIFQRPESHRVHHQFHHHTNNFADIPLWDMLFGTVRNPKTFKGRCGYEQ